MRACAATEARRAGVRLSLRSNNSLGYHLHYHTKGLDEGDDAPGLWRSPEHVHLSIGCESMDHTDEENKRCPYHKQRAVDKRDERNKRSRIS